MKRYYWGFFFVVVLGITSLLFTLRSDVYATVAVPATSQIALTVKHDSSRIKVGECIRMARRMGADCLR